MDASKIRRAVERVIDLYLEIDYFGIQAAAYDPDTRITGGTASAAPDRHTRLWKASVARILAALPADSRNALERVAGLRANEYEYARNCACFTKALANPRVSNHRGRRDDIEGWRKLTDAIYGAIHAERSRSQRAGVYLRAVDAFWIELNERDREFPAESIRSFILDEVEGRKRRVS